MKYFTVLSLCFLLLVSCNNSKTNKSVDKKDDASEVIENLSTPQKIAKANGLHSWQDINEIHFTFNVDRTDFHMERSWVWKPKSDIIRFKDEKDTIQYSQSKLDSLLTPIDAKFVNDKYWLLAPLNLAWDEKNYTFSEEINSIAPISKDTLNKLTIVYKDEGGYTPGDAYDFYFNDEFIIKEWTYRQENNPVPSLTTTWENHELYKGLYIAKNHITDDGSLKIYFTNIKVK